MSAELTDRLRRAVTRLEERRDSLPKWHPDRTRLNGKIEGVKLVDSYLEEEERIFGTETSHPETVTTVAELDALPVGSVVLDRHADAWMFGVDLDGRFAWFSGSQIPHSGYAVGLPATVLYRGES